MHHFNIITRRSFLDRSFKIGMGVALSTLVDIPLVMKRALAEGTIGSGKKLLFIWLRGANDSINSVIPIQDSAYNTDINPATGTVVRPNLAISKDGLTDYSEVTGMADFPQSSSVSTDPNFATYFYSNAINLRNGFAALHPSHKFLAPVYNAGDLALVHRVGYPKQSRSHFDSQNYWENGNPNNNVSQDGIFYRTVIESGLANTSPLTGVSVQSALPLILRGSAAAMTNLTDPTRYNLLGIPNTGPGNTKSDNALLNANSYPFPDKQNRELLSLQYKNMANTLKIFESIYFDEAHNTFVDDTNTDGDTAPYYLFPTTNAKNGGYALHGNNTAKYVVDTGAYNSTGTGFFNNLKAAALILNNTDAIIAGTEMTGFDTHNSQGGITGTHPNLQRRIAWAMYALRKYFLNYHDKCTWNNLIVVTLSEFGRTTIQNTSLGTDHAEAGVMFIAGGNAAGGGSLHGGIYGCHPNDNYNSHSLPWNTGLTGSMFGVNSRYLKRAIDYRSVLGELIRDHLGATQPQLNRIIPGYANSAEHLQSGGTSAIDGTPIAGEIGIV
jgi:uncharacterized protein (DUF1501 family)